MWRRSGDNAGWHEFEAGTVPKIQGHAQATVLGFQFIQEVVFSTKFPVFDQKFFIFDFELIERLQAAANRSEIFLHRTARSQKR